MIVWKPIIVLEKLEKVIVGRARRRFTLVFLKTLLYLLSCRPNVCLSDTICLLASTVRWESPLIYVVWSPNVHTDVDEIAYPTRRHSVC